MEVETSDKMWATKLTTNSIQGKAYVKVSVFPPRSVWCFAKSCLSRDAGLGAGGRPHAEVDPHTDVRRERHSHNGKLQALVTTCFLQSMP